MGELQDIFSSKKVVEDKIVTKVIIDSREKQSFVPSYLGGLKVPFVFETLEIGDYRVGDVVIERKTAFDFVGSLKSKRLHEQLINLSKYEKCFLLFEGFDFRYDKYGIHENALRGMLLSVVCDFGIPIIYTKDASDSAKFLYSLAKRMDKEKSVPALRQAKSFSSLSEQKQFILEGFPGIGPVLASKLLERFGSLEKVFSSSVEDLSSLEKFDEKKVKDFKKLLLE